MKCKVPLLQIFILCDNAIQKNHSLLLCLEDIQVYSSFPILNDNNRIKIWIISRCIWVTLDVLCGVGVCCWLGRWSPGA